MNYRYKFLVFFIGLTLSTRCISQANDYYLNKGKKMVLYDAMPFIDEEYTIVVGETTIDKSKRGLIVKAPIDQKPSQYTFNKDNDGDITFVALDAFERENKNYLVVVGSYERDEKKQGYISSFSLSDEITQNQSLKVGIENVMFNDVITTSDKNIIAVGSKKNTPWIVITNNNLKIELEMTSWKGSPKYGSIVKIIQLTPENSKSTKYVVLVKVSKEKYMLQYFSYNKKNITPMAKVNLLENFTPNDLMITKTKDIIIVGSENKENIEYPAYQVINENKKQKSKKTYNQHFDSRFTGVVQFHDSSFAFTGYGTGYRKGEFVSKGFLMYSDLPDSIKWIGSIKKDQINTIIKPQSGKLLMAGATKKKSGIGWIHQEKYEIISKEEKRIALLIGNANYTNSPLKNPVNDIDTLDKKLKVLGFEVIKLSNLNFVQMERAIKNFGKQATEGDYNIRLFYYSGHGSEIPIGHQKENYLHPISDATKKNECQITLSSVKDELKVEDNNVLNLLIIDACRGGNDSLSKIGEVCNFDPSKTIVTSTPINFFTTYSTYGGKPAYDGINEEANNSPFIEELIKQLNHSKSLFAIMSGLRTKMEEKFKNKDIYQMPDEDNNINNQYTHFQFKYK